MSRQLRAGIETRAVSHDAKPPEQRYVPLCSSAYHNANRGDMQKLSSLSLKLSSFALLKWVLVPKLGDVSVVVGVVIGLLAWVIGFLKWGPILGNWGTRK